MVVATYHLRRTLDTYCTLLAWIAFLLPAWNVSSLGSHLFSAVPDKDSPQKGTQYVLPHASLLVCIVTTVVSVAMKAILSEPGLGSITFKCNALPLHYI